MRQTFSPFIEQLIESLRCLPGIGQKSAQRIAFYLLERNRQGGLKLAEHLLQAMQNIKNCTQCRNFSDTSICHLCANPKRDAHLLCIVETPLDVIAIEQTNHYYGHYFVLQGHLSPIDGIGPNEIGLPELVQRVKSQSPHEIILATNPTVEGEVTAHHIIKLLKSLTAPVELLFSRIAHGVHMGVELEYADGKTLAYAISHRLPVYPEMTK